MENNWIFVYYWHSHLFKLTHRDTELTIIHATREDEGIYQCMVRNSIGTATAEAKLKIYLPHQEALDESLTGEILESIVEKAKQSVDRSKIFQLFHKIFLNKQKFAWIWCHLLRKNWKWYHFLVYFENGTSISLIIRNLKKIKVIFFRAINESKSLVNINEMSPWEIMKQFRFNVPQNAALTKAREIYEQSLLLVQQHIRDGQLLQVYLWLMLIENRKIWAFKSTIKTMDSD